MDYQKLRNNSKLVFDPSCCDVYHSHFWECDSKDFYEGAVEAIPPNAPPPRGKEVGLYMFIDSNHAGDKHTRRFMICMIMSLINWYSKKQCIIESSVFGAAFVAMKVGVKILHVILYKLRMMGIPMSGPQYIYGNKMLVIHKGYSTSQTT